MTANDYVLSYFIEEYLAAPRGSDEYRDATIFMDNRLDALISANRVTYKDLAAIHLAVIHKEAVWTKIQYSVIVIWATGVNLVCALVRKPFKYQ